MFLLLFKSARVIVLCFYTSSESLNAVVLALNSAGCLCFDAPDNSLWHDCIIAGTATNLTGVLLLA